MHDADKTYSTMDSVRADQFKLAEWVGNGLNEASFKQPTEFNENRCWKMLIFLKTFCVLLFMNAKTNRRDTFISFHRWEKGHGTFASVRHQAFTLHFTRLTFIVCYVVYMCLPSESESGSVRWPQRCGTGDSKRLFLGRFWSSGSHVGLVLAVCVYVCPVFSG